MDENVAETGIGRIGANAGQVLVHPNGQVADLHHMIAGVHGRVGGIAVPQLPHRGGALRDHVAPAGISGLGGDLIGQIGAAVIGKRAHEELRAHQASADVAVGHLYDIVHQAGEQGGAIFGRRQIEEQRQNARRLCGVVIDAGGGLQEALLERRVHLFGERFIAGGVRGLIEHAGIARREAQQVIVICRRDQCAIGDASGIFGMDQLGIFRRHAPIGVHVLGHEAVLQVAALVLDPFLDGRISALQHAPVAILVVQHTGHEEEGAGPGDVVVIERPVVGRHVGDAAIGALRVGQILLPLGIERGDVEHVGFAAAHLRTVAEPALALVALRAIGGNAAIIAADAPKHVVVNLIQHLAGAGEIGDRLHVVMDHAAYERGCGGRGVAGPAGQFDVAKAVIGEARLIHLGAFAPERVDIGGARGAQIGDIK